EKFNIEKIPLSKLKNLLPEKLLRQFINAGYQLSNLENIIKDKNGESTYLVYNMAGFLHHETTNLKCIWVTVDDITRIRSSEARLEMALAGGQLGIWDMHLPTGHSVYDERLSQMLGYELKELGSNVKVWQELIHPDDLPKLEQNLNKHLEGKAKEYRFEFRARCKNGQYKWILAVGKALEFDEKGKPLRATGIHMDISERKDTERQLDDSNYFISSIVNNLQEGLVVYDLDYNVILWNKKMEQITGICSNEMLNRNPLFIFPHLQSENYEKYFQQVKSGEVCSSSDIYFTNQKGSSIWYNSIFSPYKSNKGEILGIIEILRDISERKRHESKLAHHNEELQKANQELDNFVYRVSHDLRAPITSSLGLARLSKKESDLAILHQYGQMQEQSLVKLDKFIHDILDYSRNSRIEISPGPIYFESLINEVLKNHVRMKEDEDVSIELTIDHVIDFYSDELRLRIILNNLISNALKFKNMYQDKPFVKITVKIRGNDASLIIEDNGIGIAEKHQNKLFQMFYRATDKMPGSGIGLYIVKDCLKKLGGDIKVKSELGKGCKFTVTLPNLR
ncbi:MAG: sensor histidine kinase, partial [Cyclobacteriaceae bacterium]